VTVSIGRFYTSMLMVLILVLGYLAYQVFAPFLKPLAWAVVLSVLFYPVYEIIRRKLRWKSFAAGRWSRLS
jgi:predicted PurR-regulated permease PerM